VGARVAHGRTLTRCCAVALSHLQFIVFVITGLVPVIPMRRARCLFDRDGRDKPGHDIERIAHPVVYPIQFSNSELRIQLRDLAARFRVRALIIPLALQMRARGTPDAQRIRSPVCKSEKHTSVVTTNTPKTSGVPHAMGYGLLRALPGDRSICFVTVVATEDVSLPGWAGLSGATFANVRASGPHDLGRPGQRRRQRFIGHSRTLFGESALSLHPRLTLPRPPHPAPRP
jgi:hypothetical protein